MHCLVDECDLKHLRFEIVQYGHLRFGGAIQKKWSEIQSMPVRAGQQTSKRQVLCLRLAKPDVWTQHAVSQVHTFVSRHETEDESVWMSRGELEMKVGQETASEWIERGKVDRAEDSDGDSIYRKRNKKERHVGRIDTTHQVKRSGAIDPTDFTGLKDALIDKAKKSMNIFRKEPALCSAGPPVLQDETDAQRLERLKQEEKEKKIAERAEKKRIADEEKAKAATPETIAREKAEQILKMYSKAKAEMSTKIVKLKGVKLAVSIKDEYSNLLKDANGFEKELVGLTAKRVLEVRRTKEVISKLATKIQKKAGIDKLAKPHLK